MPKRRIFCGLIVFLVLVSFYERSQGQIRPSLRYHMVYDLHDRNPSSRANVISTQPRDEASLARLGLAGVAGWGLGGLAGGALGFLYDRVNETLGVHFVGGVLGITIGTPAAVYIANQPRRGNVLLGILGSAAVTSGMLYIMATYDDQGINDRAVVLGSIPVHVGVSVAIEKLTSGNY